MQIISYIFLSKKKKKKLEQLGNLTQPIIDTIIETLVTLEEFILKNIFC